MVFSSTVETKLTVLVSTHAGFANKSPIVSVHFLNEQGGLHVAPYKALSGRTLVALVCRHVLM